MRYTLRFHHLYCTEPFQIFASDTQLLLLIIGHSLKWNNLFKIESNVFKFFYCFYLFFFEKLEKLVC